MYFPFLRGKQYELIALRDLSDLLSTNRNKVSPIIEPVKESFTTLRSTLEALRNGNVNFNVIVNPVFGDLVGRTDEVLKFVKETLEGYKNFQIGYYLSKDRDVRESIQSAINITFDYSGISFIHAFQITNFKELQDYKPKNKVLYHIVDFKKTSRRYHRNLTGKIVSLEDHFVIQDRNSNYLSNPDEFFSEEHLYYLKDGFKGFSDYLMIGDSFSESGFLPYAVVIHLTYPDSDKKLRIHHFVSNSNDDTTDVAGKFGEALQKLIGWLGTNIITSQAIEEFKDLHKNGHFPGLGYIKKLSLKHHIELVTSLLQ